MTPAPPPQDFLEWWETHPHSDAITAGEAWFCKAYRGQWSESLRASPEQPSEQWWNR